MPLEFCTFYIVLDDLSLYFCLSSITIFLRYEWTEEPSIFLSSLPPSIN